MKKILVSFIAMMAVASSAWAAETMNMHDQVNNAQAPAHQMQSSAEKSAVQGESMKMMKSKPAASNETAKSFSEMNEHEKAAVMHEKANNGQSSVIHQQQAEKHRSQITQN
ncbi:Probable copper-binding protein pcoE precursor [Citrobacter freundii]|uniref:copper-binding protein n=1 Tax=Citrobacter freundii TaxID=546 RepID=UPI000DF100A3|nr:copper-binding protein [Citrobacter freundii]STB73860.1 Probable copper-binding protein pcoE precursor [Citrobacter freundii]